MERSFYTCSTLGSIQDIIVYKILNNFKCYFFRDHSLPMPHHFKWNWKNCRFWIAGWHLYCPLERDSPYTVRRCEFSMHTFQATFWVLMSRILSEKSKCVSFISLSFSQGCWYPIGKWYFFMNTSFFSLEFRRGLEVL